MQRIEEPPRLLVWLSGAALLVTVVLAFAGAWRSGVAWDETYHVDRMDNYLDSGWYVLDRDLAGEGPTAEGRTTYVYGPVTMILLHAWETVLGVDGVGTTMHAYAVRHLGVVLLGLIGMAAAAAIAGSILGRRWGLVTAGMLGALPLWTGHLMFNLKDVPVATGCTLVTLALVLLARSEPTDGWRSRLTRIACLGAGTTLAMGTRPGTWAAVAAGLCTFVALAALARGVKAVLPSLVEIVVGLAVAGGLLLAAYPKAFSTPLTALRRSAESSSRFRDGDQGDRLYLFEHVATGIPLLLVALWLLGSAVGIVWILRLRSDGVRAVQIGVVGVQAFTLPLLAVVLESDLYNGLRQMLFVVPACAILGTVGLAWLLPRLPRPRLLVPGIALLGLVLPVADQLTLFPYGYTYANAATDLAGRHVETDYWRTSVRELTPHVPTDGQVVCTPFLLPDGTAIRETSDGSIDCRVAPYGPLAAAWADRDLPRSYDIPDRDFYAVINGDNPVPPNCETLHEVTRWRHGRTAVMSLVARCTLPAAPLPSGGVAFDATVPSWRFAVRGWEAGVLRGGLHSYGDDASVAFGTPAACSTRTCVLTVAADLPADVVVTGAGRELAVERVGARRARIELPADLVRAAGEDGVWLTFARNGDGPLDMTLRKLRLYPS